MKCVNRNNETVKILGILFSYDKNLEQKKKKLRRSCQKKKNIFKIMEHHETVNFRRKNYGVQIASCF